VKSRGNAVAVMQSRSQGPTRSDGADRITFRPWLSCACMDNISHYNASKLPHDQDTSNVFARRSGYEGVIRTCMPSDARKSVPSHVLRRRQMPETDRALGRESITPPSHDTQRTLSYHNPNAVTLVFTCEVTTPVCRSQDMYMQAS
jgi:hypothetical protein